MAFSQQDILEEFVEAARTTHDWAAHAEHAYFRLRLHRLAKNREYCATWRAKPSSKEKMRAKRRLWYWRHRERYLAAKAEKWKNRSPEEVERQRLYQAEHRRKKREEAIRLRQNG